MHLALAALLLAASAASSHEELAARLLQAADGRSFDAQTLAAAAEASPALRRQCARVLGGLREERAARLLLRLVHDSDPGVRGEALASVGRLLPWLPQQGVAERLRRGLAAGLADPHPGVRQAAIWAWAFAGEGEAGLLSALARERETSVKAAILRELWRYPSSSWQAVAARYAKASQLELRQAAWWSLARGKADVEQLLPDALADSDPEVRRYACEAVRRGKLVAQAGKLAPLVADPEEAVRVAALEALAELGEAARGVVSGKTVGELLAREDLAHPHLRVAAIRLAGAVGCCQEQLLGLLEEGGWWGGEALLALARQGKREVVERELASGDPFFRRWAVQALAWVAGGEKLLERAFADPLPAVRLAAAEVAGKLGKPSVLPALEKLLGDGDSAVRAQACESLDALGARPDPATLARLLQLELGNPNGDAAVSLVRLLGKENPLSPEAAAALEQARYHRELAVAEAAWEELFRHGRKRPFPARKPPKPESFYREVARFAAKPRYLEVLTTRGSFVVRLDTENAPLSSYALGKLAEAKFYDKLTFHRVVSNFVVQGGDPRGDGWGGPGFYLRDELSLVPYGPGAVGLALAGPDTAGSQFFVTLTPQPHLVGRYPRVGEVAGGFDVVQRLQLGDEILRIRPGEGPPPTPIPVWYGPLAVEQLEQAFQEFRQHREEYQPQARWLAFLEKAKGKYGLVVAMGTWCSDSREQVPRLLKILELLGPANPFPELVLLGVDRGKKVVPAARFPYGPVERVPTIVVTFGGSEVGRFVETPLSGSLEEDLVRILAPLEGWDVPEEGR